MVSNVFVRQQRGMVSIFSVMIIMGLLGVIVLGYSSYVRTAQIRTLDDHLGIQAHYAAESGINLGISQVASGAVLKEDCAPDSPGDYDLDAPSGVSIQCLTYNTRLPDYTSADIGQDPNVSFVDLHSRYVTGVRVRFDSSDVSINNKGVLTGGVPRLLSSDEWAPNIGILKVDINILPSSMTYDRSSLAASKYSFYLYPTTTNPTATYSLNPGSDSGFLGARCSSSGTFADGADSIGKYRCQADILFINRPALSNYLVINQSSIYSSPGTSNDMQSSISFMGAPLVSGEVSAAGFLYVINTQADIDSTGNANGVLKRLRVRVPLKRDDAFAHGLSVFSGDRLCKRYSYVLSSTGDALPADDCPSPGP